MKHLREFTVVQSNATTKNTFITKLVSEQQVDLGILGTKTKKETYYISTNKEVGSGEVVRVDMSLFNIVERPFKGTDDVEVMLKWLHLN